MIQKWLVLQIEKEDSETAVSEKESVISIATFRFVLLISDRWRRRGVCCMN